MKEFFLKICIGFGAGLVISHLGIAADKAPAKPRGEAAVKASAVTLLSKHFIGANIEILPTTKMPKIGAREEIVHADLGRIVPNGQTEIFITTGGGRLLVGTIHYEARVPTFVSMRRIRPGERLAQDDFQVQEVNVAQGLNYEYRGLIVSKDTPIQEYQARQTILEGQYPLRTGIERVPDVKRGDMVQVKIISGGVQLATSAQVQEPGYRNSTVRVLTSKTKKELQGTVKEGGIVEVQL